MCTDQVSTISVVHLTVYVIRVIARKASCYPLPSHKGETARKPVDGRRNQLINHDGCNQGAAITAFSSSSVIKD